MIQKPRFPIPEGYSFIKELGNGFLGCSVLLRTILPPQKLIVCKFVENSQIGSIDRINRFKERLSHISLLNSPFVISYSKIVDTNEGFYLFRDYISSNSLSESISNLEKTDPNCIVAMWNIIVRTFLHLHSHHIFPNFINSNNLFLIENKYLLITDLYSPIFDINFFNKSPNPIEFGFLAPEFFSKKFDLSIESDYWTLGVLLIFMFNGSLPWNIKNIFLMIDDINNKKFTLNKFIPSSILELINNILKIDPQNRLSLNKILEIHNNNVFRTESLPIPKVLESKNIINLQNKPDSDPRKRSSSIKNVSNIILNDKRIPKTSFSILQKFPENSDIVIRCRSFQCSTNFC